MLQKIRATVRRDNKALLLAALFSGAVFASHYPVAVAEPELLGRHLAMVGLLFVFSYLVFHLFGAGVRSHVERELAEVEDANRKLVRMFVIYKELVKTVVGVSLTLGWLAGLLFLTENFSQASLLLPVLLGCALSGLVFGMAMVFTSFVDHIRYPQGH